MYTLKVKRSALKALIDLPRGTKRQVEETLDTLKARPIPARTNDVIKLRGVKDSFRIRIGDIRIVYTIEQQDHNDPVHRPERRRILRPVEELNGYQGEWNQEEYVCAASPC